MWKWPSARRLHDPEWDVDAGRSDVCLRPGSRDRAGYERPAPEVEAFIADYFVTDSDIVLWGDRPESTVSDGARIWLSVSAGPICIRTRSVTDTTIPTAALIDTPLGSARLFHQPADRLRDRILGLGYALAQPRGRKPAGAAVALSTIIPADGRDG